MAKLSFFKNYPIKELKQDCITKNIVDLSRYVRSSNDLLLKKYEYYDYNIAGAYMGEKTPIYMETEFE